MTSITVKIRLLQFNNKKNKQLKLFRLINNKMNTKEIYKWLNNIYYRSSRGPGNSASCRS